MPVDTGQAGRRVDCSCGNSLEVPTLRQLRHLPREAEEQIVRPAAIWGTRQGIVAASLIALAGLLSTSGWIWWTQPVMPKFEPAARIQVVEESLKTPARAWEGWIDYYRPMAERGFPIFRVGNAAQIEEAIGRSRFFLGMLLTLAATLAVVALSAVFWPRPTRRL